MCAINVSYKRKLHMFFSDFLCQDFRSASVGVCASANVTVSICRAYLWALPVPAQIEIRHKLASGAAAAE